MDMRILPVLILLTACAAPSWNARVGNYTYEEAVDDNGRPDSCENIDTGTWTLDRRGEDDKLILVFDRDNVLTAAEQEPD
jgi:hypothetical protein